MKKTLLAVLFGLMLGCAEKTSEQHMEAARQHLEQNNIEAAVLELKNAVQLDPNSAQARFELGSVYLQQKNFEGAEKELNRALEYGYEATKVIPMLSKAYKQTGAYAALSEIDHDEAGLSEVEQAEVSFFKIQSLLQLEKIEEAKALIEEVNQLDTRTVYKSLALAYLPLLDKDFESALSALEIAREQSPLNADVLKLQGQLLLQLGRTPEAIEVYQNYTRQYPEDSQTLFVLANIMIESGMTEEAEPIVDGLLEISAENAFLNQLKATVLASRNDHKNAQVFAEKSILNGRNDPVVRLIAGFAAYQNDDFEAANRHLSYIASSLPDGHPGLKLLAASQLQIGQSSEAGDVLSRLEQVTEQDALLFSKTGYELIRSGNFKQAKEVVERTSFISRSAEDLTRLGVLKLSLNDVQGIVNLEEAVEQAPDMVSAKSTLASAYLLSNQLDKAADLADEWKRTIPDDASAYMLAGEVLVKQGKLEAAKGEYNKVLGMDADNTLAKLALVNIDMRQGNASSAETNLAEVLKSSPQSVPALATHYALYSQKNSPELAIKPAVDALASNPDNQALAVLLARMHMAQRSWPKALETLSNFPIDASSSANLLQVKGQALLRANKVAEANEHYDKWLELTPAAKPAILGKLLLLDSQNKFSDGLALSESFLDKRDDQQMNLLHTHFLIMSGEYKKGRQSYEALPDNVKELPFVKGFVAKLLLAEGNPEQALPFAKASYENIQNSRNLIILISALELSGDETQSMALLEKHVEQKPNDVAAKMLLAERQISDNQSDAITTYEESLKLNPDNFVVLNNLAYLYKEEGRLDEAKQHATRAVDIRPENAAALDTLAQILVAQEDLEGALSYYDRAVDDKMRNEEIFLNYIETLLAAKKTRIAQRRLESREMNDEASKLRVAELKQKYGI